MIFQAKKSGRYDQGILDVGLTAEDKVELVKTHTFLRKHATGKCKIELHVLHVERGKILILCVFNLISVRFWNFKDGGSQKLLAKNQHTPKEKFKKSYEEWQFIKNWA